MSKKHATNETLTETHNVKADDYTPAVDDVIHMSDRSYKVTSTDGKCVGFTETMNDGSKPFKDSHSEELTYFLERIADHKKIEKEDA